MDSLLQTLATTETTTWTWNPVFTALVVVLALVAIAGYWKLFEKAEEPGWKAIVPFLNTYTLFRIAGRNGWGFLLLLIPLVNIAVMIVISADIAKKFGKSVIYGVIGLFLFPYVFYVLLGFGDAKYLGPKHD